MKKKALCLVACLAMLCGSAAAETEVLLPGSSYRLTIPDGMQYSEPREGDNGTYAWYSDRLEIDYVRTPKMQLFDPDDERTLQRLAEIRTDAGIDVEIREINGIGMLVSWVTDEADGTPGISYLFFDGNWAEEVFFWYAGQEEAEVTAEVMMSIRETNE